MNDMVNRLNKQIVFWYLKYSNISYVKDTLLKGTKRQQTGQMGQNIQN